MAAGKKGGLGRGLDALFADAVPVYDEAGAVKAQAKDTEKKGKAEHHSADRCQKTGERLRDRSRRAQMARGQKGRIITGSLSGQRADR